MDARIRGALRRGRHRRFARLLTSALALSACSVWAQTQPATPMRHQENAAHADATVADSATGTTAIDTAAAGIPPQASTDPIFEAFVDGAVAAALQRDDIPGMVVSVVSGDRVLLAKGYGLARVDPPWPADGHESLFRIGSVSKTFTYTAVMQLVAQGRIDLDDPIDRHLPPPLRVPAQGFEEPIRVRHLMTHTAGFEDIVLGHLFKRDPARVETLDAYLQQRRPARVRAPGTHAVYSNYGVALLGALVAHVSGMPFEDYIERNVTDPLGMQHTTFREPLQADDARRIDPRLEAVLATGHERRQGAFVPAGFEYIAHGAPAGAASASAADMARWMRMHLGEGALDGVRVLPEAQARAMREVLFTNAEGASGVAHGFLTGELDGAFVYGHGGATLYFHTAMLLVPEHEAGVFVSANSSNARASVRDLAQLLLRRVLTRPPGTRLSGTDSSGTEPSGTEPSGTGDTDARIDVAPAELARYAGNYASNRRPYRSVEKLLLGATSLASVSVADDGSLRVSQGSETVRYLPVATHRFRAPESGQRLAFLVDGDGRVTGYVTDPAIAVMERVGPLRTPGQLALLLTLAVAVAIARLLGSLRRRQGRHAIGHAPAPARPGLWPVKALALVDALAWIAFIAVAMASVAAMVTAGTAVLYTYPSDLLVAALVLATVAAVLTALEVLALVPVWLGRWRPWPKLRYTLGVAVLAFAVAAMWHWNLIGVRV